MNLTTVCCAVLICAVFAWLAYGVSFFAALSFGALLAAAAYAVIYGLIRLFKFWAS